MRLILLPQLIILILMQVPRFSQDEGDLLDSFGPELAVGDAEHSSELPHLFEINRLLFLTGLPGLVSTDPFLDEYSRVECLFVP